MMVIMVDIWMNNGISEQLLTELTIFIYFPKYLKLIGFSKVQLLLQKS